MFHIYIHKKINPYKLCSVLFDMHGKSLPFYSIIVILCVFIVSENSNILKKSAHLVCLIGIRNR